MVESLASVAPFLDSITSARTQETTQLKIDTWVEDSLTSFDFGYLDYERLGRIENDDGWFVSQLNADANLHVIKEPRTVRGNSIDREGTHFQEVPPGFFISKPSMSRQGSARIRMICAFPATPESSVFATRTMMTLLLIVTMSKPTTSTTFTRRIS